MTEFLLILGVVVLSFALRTLSWPPCRKLGAIGFLAAFFLVGYFLSGKIWVGAALVGMWFLFPWVELLTRTRKMRLPVKRNLSSQAPPGQQRFPSLEPMTAEIEAEGFEYVKDTGWSWQESKQFFRFFYHPERRAQVAICFTEQKHYSWACITLTVRHPNGKVYRSTNIPFSTPMKSAPGVIVRRDLSAVTFPDFLDGHDLWFEGLGLNGAELLEQSPAEITEQFELENGSQISHNVESGIISVCDKADTWRYSWRGLIYLYFQALKDFVRWC